MQFSGDWDRWFGMQQSIINCFSPLGKMPHGLPEAFLMYHFFGWRYPTMSPIFPTGKVLLAENLRQLEAYFEQSPAETSFDWDTPYINLITSSEGDSAGEIINLLKEEGWVLVPEKAKNLNYFEKIREATLPAGFKVGSGDFFDTEINKDFISVVRVVFEETDESERNIHKAAKSASNPQAVVISTDGGKPIAAGAVFTRGDFAYLYADSVVREFRCLGLWKVLLSVRQEISANLGAKHWIYLSDTLQIKNQGDKVHEIITYKKPSP